MSYTVIVHARDGSTLREYHKVTSCPPSSKRMNARQRRAAIDRHLEFMRASTRKNKGWNRTKTGRLVASIPPEVLAHVMRNEGPEAAKDPRYLIRRAEQLGHDVRVSGGRF